MSDSCYTLIADYDEGDAPTEQELKKELGKPIVSLSLHLVSIFDVVFAIICFRKRTNPSENYSVEEGHHPLAPRREAPLNTDGKKTQH
jgi:hypothetical protein